MPDRLNLHRRQDPQPAAEKWPHFGHATPEQLLLEGKLLSLADFANQLNWTEEAVSEALTSNRLFYIEYQGRRYIPAFYLDSSYQRSHLEVVTRVLGDLPGGAKLQFFLNPRASLAGATPLAALAAGKLEKVRDIAAAFADVR